MSAPKPLRERKEDNETECYLWDTVVSGGSGRDPSSVGRLADQQGRSHNERKDDTQDGAGCGATFGKYKFAGHYFDACVCGRLDEDGNTETCPACAKNLTDERDEVKAQLEAVMSDKFRAIKIEREVFDGCGIEGCGDAGRFCDDCGEEASDLLYWANYWNAHHTEKFLAVKAKADAMKAECAAYKAGWGIIEEFTLLLTGMKDEGLSEDVSIELVISKVLDADRVRTLPAETETEKEQWHITASGDIRVVPGNGTFYAEIVASDNVVNPTIGDGLWAVTYWGTVADGEVLVLDAGKGTATLNGADVIPYTTGEFPRASLEGTTLTYTDDIESSHTASILVLWKDRRKTETEKECETPHRPVRYIRNVCGHPIEDDCDC